ncbi:MAG: hypothetical protein PUC18_08135, partial [Prevotellaceae bacterium]|nr:hypothetical protein [Prevotellaceae bacterium]
CGYDTKIYSHVWKAPTQAIKYQRFQRTIILWRLGRCVIIQNFNELLLLLIFAKRTILYLLA